MLVYSKLQFTHASSFSHSWLGRQLQLVQSSKLVVASLSCAELGTAQPQLVFHFFCGGTLSSIDPGLKGSSYFKSSLEKPSDKCQRTQWRDVMPLDNTLWRHYAPRHYAPVKLCPDR